MRARRNVPRRRGLGMRERQSGRWICSRRKEKEEKIIVITCFLVTVQPCAGLNEKVCCKLACISTFSSKSAYGGTTKLLVFMNMKTRRYND